MSRAIRLANAIINYGEGFFTETNAVGGGEWSLEVYCYDLDDNKVFVCEFVGANGTHDEADDLYAWFDYTYQAAKGYLAVWFGGGFTVK